MIKPSRFIIAIVMAPSLANAQSMDDFISENDFLDELPIILSATRLKQPLNDTPQAMTVIEENLIQASGAQNVPDILRLVPGFQIGQVTGSIPTVTYHGMSDRYARNMQVLLDGRSVYDAGYGGVSWANLGLNIDDIERIEVIRGPNAASYGANAFSATINIITKHPSEQLGTRSKLTLGTKQTRQIDLSHAGQNADLDYRLSASRVESNGLTSRYDDYRTQQVNLRADYQLSLKDKIRFTSSYSSSNQDDGFNDLPPDTDTVYQPRRTVTRKQNTQQIKWDRILADENELSIQFYHSHQDINDAFKTMLFSEFNPDLVPSIIMPIFAEGDQRLNIDNSLFSHRYDIGLQHNLRLNSDLRISWGLGARQDSASSFGTFATDKQFKRKHVRAFINTEWYAQNNIVINAGSMYENYNGFSPIWSPRLALNFHLNNQHTFRISATQAYRMPTLLESNADIRAYFQNGKTFDFITSSSNPQAERIRSYELGYIGELKTYSLQWDAKLFRDEQSQLIRDLSITDCLESPDNTSQVCDAFDTAGAQEYRGGFTYNNAGQATISGLEIGSQWHLSSNTQLRLAYSYAHTSSQYSNALNASSLSQTNIEAPKQTYNIMLQHRWSKSLNSSLIYYYQNALKWRGEGNFNPQYERFDARISKTFKALDYQAELNLIAQNISADYTNFQSENSIDSTLLAEFKIYIE